MYRKGQIPTMKSLRGRILTRTLVYYRSFLEAYLRTLNHLLQFYGNSHQLICPFPNAFDRSDSNARRGRFNNIAYFLTSLGL